MHVAADDFAVGADQEHGRQDDNAVLVGERAFQAAGLEELNAGAARHRRAGDGRAAVQVNAHHFEPLTLCAALVVVDAEQFLHPREIADRLLVRAVPVIDDDHFAAQAADVKARAGDGGAGQLDGLPFQLEAAEGALGLGHE